MFKRKKQNNIDGRLEEVIKTLSELEPERMKRLVELAKTVRKTNQKVDCFINGRPDEVDRIIKDIQ